MGEMLVALNSLNNMNRDRKNVACPKSHRSYLDRILPFLAVARRFGHNLANTDGCIEATLQSRHPSMGQDPCTEEIYYTTQGLFHNNIFHHLEYIVRHNNYNH